MGNEQTAIKITNLVKEYKMFNSKKDRLIEAIFPSMKKHSEFRAMDNLNLEVKKGEVLGILGKNGAGKSTLLKMITGVVTPTSGEIQVNGKISSLLELGAAFNGDLTGIENIYQHGTVMGLTKEQIDERKQEIIDFADIGDHLYQQVKTYSSGMFARLAFACAINVDPEILIVDEVLSVGDIAFQMKCFKKFEEFKKKGKTILFVSHSVNDIIRNCNRAIIIDAGSKVFDGNVKEGVDIYKKMIVKVEQEEIESIKKVTESKEDNVKPNIQNSDNNDVWKEHFTLNPDILSYGNLKAEIIDYGVFNLNGEYQQTINNNDKYVVKMKVKFNKDIVEPIFALAIKDIKGLELAGVNTKIYKKETGIFKKGEVVIIEFRQAIPLAPDRYTISFGCTKYDKNGDLEIFDRKYDALFLEILSYRGCLGLLDLKSEISLK